MRLLFVCPDMRTGGAERHWATLVPALRERGVEAAVLCLTGEGPFYGELRARGVPVISIRMRGRFDVAGWRRALACAATRPDVVVSRFVSAQLVGARIARRAGARHVLNEHMPVRADGQLVPPRPHQRVLTRAATRRVDAVIAVSDSQVEPLKALGYRNITVVPNGVFEADVAGVAPSPEFEGDGFAALCVSGLRPEKRVDVFIEAVRAAHGENEAIRGYVAGEGREDSRLAALADGSRVELLGVRTDARELMRAAGVVCLTSEAEALPMSVLEAMALGRPVVATSVGGTADAVVDGDTGFLTPPGDVEAVTRALVKLAGDRERAAAMGAAGRRRQRERFDGDAMVDGYLRVLGEITAAGPRSSRR
jgi:glycosyltransferase involved in cell wall biosynthesis